MTYIDPSGRGPRAATLAVRGVVYLAVLLLIGTFLLLQSRGAFRDDFAATAVVSDVGDGLPVGSDVKVRGVLVGTVAAVESQAGAARHVVRLKLRPEQVSGIPASVKARIVPTNIFGSPSVELVPAPGDTAPLTAETVITSDDSQETVQLQTAMTKLKDILTAVQPSKVNAALTGISQALAGRGEQLGNMVGRLDDYLTALNAQTPAFSHDITALASALEGLQRTAPALLDTVDSALVTTKTIVDKQQQLAASLAGGAVAVDTVRGFMNDNANRVITVIKQSRPIVGTIAKQSGAIPVSFDALGRGATAVSSAFPGGKLTIDLVISLSPFHLYTPADCPRYPGMNGPNCGRRFENPLPPPAPVPVEAPDVMPQGGTVGPVGSPQEIEQLNNLIGGSGSLGDLLLGPILRGLTVVVPR
ncbi:MCE family protein [Amycolatopsis sp. cg5]|uniref:MCE family protein n=1 Tax=Amycolatopsis sp. cg5 TaxID=3238802 RepID=UPI003525A238